MLEAAHIHPMMVHFPIALVILGFVLELATYIFKKETWLPNTAILLLILGTIGTIAGYMSGEFLTNELTGAAGELKEKHELFAKLSMGMMILVCIVKLALSKAKKIDKSLVLLGTGLYGLGAILVGYTGYLGGTLVINFLIGL